MDYTIEAYQTKLIRWQKQFPNSVAKALEDVGPIIVNDVRSNYLSGQVLNKRTGRLRASVFTEIIKDNKGSRLGVGADAQSNRGFYYGVYWETHGRQFLRPSLKANLLKIEQKVLDNIKQAYATGEAF